MTASIAGSTVPFAVPPGACDCHIHINDPHFPYLATAQLKPPPALVEDYRAVQSRLGTSRVVVVQPSSYGVDNRCTLQAVARFGLDSARAVVVVAPDVSPQALQDLHAQGARGVRVNLARSTAPLGADQIRELAGRIAALGWHLQFFALAETLVLLEPVLRSLPVPVVIDHMGRIPPDASVAHPAFAALMRLLDGGRTWVKLSGAYLVSHSGAPGYQDCAAVARGLVGAAPERMVWGSDWPHPSATAGERPMPDAATLLGLLTDWAPDDQVRRRILVDNPASLYGFAAAGATD